MLSPSLAWWGPAQHGAPCVLGPCRALLGTLLTGELWREMAPLIPEDGLRFGGSCICEAAISNDALLPRKPLTVFCLPWSDVAGVPGHCPQGTRLVGSRTG